MFWLQTERLVYPLECNDVILLKIVTWVWNYAIVVQLKNYPSQHLSGDTIEKHETRQAEQQVSSLLASGYEPDRTSGWVTS